jgi:hypothetical protein
MTESTIVEDESSPMTKLNRLIQQVASSTDDPVYVLLLEVSHRTSSQNSAISTSNVIRDAHYIK